MYNKDIYVSSVGLKLVCRGFFSLSNQMNKLQEAGGFWKILKIKNPIKLENNKFNIKNKGTGKHYLSNRLRIKELWKYKKVTLTQIY